MRKPNETMRLIVTTFVGVIFGFFLGVSFPTLALTKVQKLFVYMVVFLLHSIPMISTKSNETYILLHSNLVDESSNQPFSFH
jgi:hypothetical protein